jgi:quinolinate synthase
VEEYDDYAYEEEDIFPSIIIRPDGIEPQGSFAKAQAQFLNPDDDEVETLSRKLSKAKMGVVAHYYMDVELQGILQAIKEQNGAVAIADSLAMGDYAVQMCENGATSIACLGVDFMAESVQAILRRNGFPNVPVYRLSSKEIGCSLAASAETDSYKAWLHKASKNSKALHVIYINTSLETKGISSSIVPTITCTSSNVVKTILQASTQIGPDLKVFYGPDTYMGLNLKSFFHQILTNWTSEKIQQELHPKHTRQTLKQLLNNINVYPNGNCVVHHMFGSEVVDTVKKNYSDAHVTAHLEVPSEMFEIAMQKSLVGKGVVGSTSDILKFISAKVAQHSPNSQNTQKLRFVLGTEAGMVTSIIKSVQTLLTPNLEAEIIFPVAAYTSVGEGEDLAVVPGVQASEGCSTAGGCATCPFMKMNDVEALQDLVDNVLQQKPNLTSYLPPNKIHNEQINGQSLMELAVEPIIHMRQFMKDNTLPDDLVKRIIQ